MTMKGIVIAAGILALVPAVPVCNRLLAQEDPQEAKVVICHVPPGNQTNAKTIQVAQSAVDAHLAHGDYLGACAAQ